MFKKSCCLVIAFKDVTSYHGSMYVLVCAGVCYAHVRGSYKRLFTDTKYRLHLNAASVYGETRTMVCHTPHAASDNDGMPYTLVYY
jgi:hypothetical protein